MIPELALTIRVPKLILRTESVTVFNVQTPNDFWVRINRFTWKYTALKGQMAHYEYEQILPVHWSVGLAAAVKSQFDTFWYRALITEIKNDSQIEVLLVDEGRLEYTDPSHLRLLRPEYYRLPRMAIHCSLYAVRPAWAQDGIYWSDNAVTFFKNALKFGGISCTFAQIIEDECKFLVGLNTGHFNESVSMMMMTAGIAELTLNPSGATITPTTIRVPEVGDTITVRFTAFNDLHDFYVLDKSTVAELRELQKKITESLEIMAHPLVNAVPGDICIVQYKDDGLYHRAKILNVDGDLLKVHFVDFGTNLSVETNACYKASKELCEFPPFVFHCSMKNADAINAPVQDIRRLFVSFNRAKDFQLQCKFERHDMDRDIYEVSLLIVTDTVTFSMEEYLAKNIKPQQQEDVQLTSTTYSPSNDGKHFDLIFGERVRCATIQRMEQ